LSLALYSSPSINSLLGDIPFTVTFDGRIGGTIERKVFVRNNNTKRYYTSIAVDVIDQSGDDWTDATTTGFTWKLSSGDIRPIIEAWDEVTPGNSISMSDIGDSVLGDIVTFYPFWVRIEVPRGLPAQKVTDLIFRVTATENFIE